MKQSICSTTAMMTTVLLVATGCSMDSEEPTTPGTAQPIETSDAGASRDSAKGSGDDASLNDTGSDSPIQSECPAPKSGETCSTSATVARNPLTATCCSYPSPCSAPVGWVTYGSVEECNETCPPPRETQPGEMCHAVAACATSPISNIKCLYPAGACAAPQEWPYVDAPDDVCE